MRLSIGTLPLLALTLAVAACESTPTAPAMQDVEVEQEVASSAEQDQRHAPTLHRLFVQAVGKIRAEAGEEAARQVASEYRRLRTEAREAHAAGDKEGALKLAREAQGMAARIVVRAFGPEGVRRVFARVATQLETVEGRIAAAEAEGRNVTRPRAVTERARRHLAAAREAAGGDRPVAALVHVTEAADLLASLARN